MLLPADILNTFIRKCPFCGELHRTATREIVMTWRHGQGNRHRLGNRKGDRINSAEVDECPVPGRLPGVDTFPSTTMAMFAVG